MTTPLDEADSQFFLGLYRCAVELYQPKIEKRTGVSLGEIKVWHFKHADEHFLRDVQRRSWLRLLGPLAGVFLKGRLRRMSEQLKSTYTDRARGCMAQYYNGGIYVSFDVDIRSHQEGVACAVVHELSHALWDRLAALPMAMEPVVTQKGRQKFQLFVEGYATYGERVWFLDFYPRDVREAMQYWRLDTR